MIETNIFQLKKKTKKLEYFWVKSEIFNWNSQSWSSVLSPEYFDKKIEKIEKIYQFELWLDELLEFLQAIGPPLPIQCKFGRKYHLPVRHTIPNIQRFR